ncbi:MAG: hypothetical protein U5R06_08285 [candidate division KSB1 bacterium]|nr:hypothetical protein [candidate division KSB1 bacterium]
MGFANSKIDSLLDKAKTVSSAENAQPLWDKFQKTILDQSPYTFLYIPDHLSAVNHNLTNTSIDIRGFLNNSHEWQLIDER